MAGTPTMTPQEGDWLEQEREFELFGKSEDAELSALNQMVADVSGLSAKPHAGCCGGHSHGGCCGRHRHGK